MPRPMSRSRWRILANAMLWWSVQASTRLANLNWMSADLQNHVLIAEFTEKYGAGAHDLVVAPVEFDGSPSALAGLTDGTADIILECWTKLKDSIGEGSNHSNFSDQSSVKILSE